MHHPSSTTPEFLSGGGEMGQLIRSFNWSQTPLGAVATWPQSLRSALSICLNSNFPIAIYWGKDLVLLYNDAWSPIPGNKHPWALGRPAKEVWPEIWDAIEPQFDKAMKGEPGGSKNALLPMERHGYVEECYFDFTFTPVYGEGGKVEGVFNAVIETTKTILNERQLETLRDLSKLDTVSKNADEVLVAAANALKGNNKDFPFAVIYKIDAEGSTANPIAYAGINEDQTVFPASIDLLHPAEGSFNFCNAFTTSQIVVSQNSGRRKNMPTGGWDKEATHFIHMPVTRHGGKHPFAIISAALNPYREFNELYRQFAQLITDQVSTELNNVLAIEEERKRAEALAQIDRAKTAFFSNISHEFRTPLTLMLSPLEEVLQDGEMLSDKGRENLKISHRNTLRLQKLVNALLDFSRIEAGKIEVNAIPTDITALTKDLVASFKPPIEKAGLKLVVNISPAQDVVYLDPDMWEKIVLNLLSNALKYTTDGSITVTQEKAGNELKLSVADTGIGIAEEEQSKIFERFHRVQNMQGRSQEGTGIGLALVQELVKLHGGSIKVESKVGKGSAFIVSIPVDVQSTAIQQTQKTESTNGEQYASNVVEEALSWIPENTGDLFAEEYATSNTGGEAKPLVLLADDNRDMRMYIQRVLSPFFNVHAVTQR